MASELDRSQIIDQNFIQRINTKDLPELGDFNKINNLLDKNTFINLFNQQILTRHIDLIARVLKLKNLCFYTIASAGHENNIALSHVFSLKDIALLHYRSSAFMLNRGYKYAGETGLEDQIREQLKSLLAAKSDKISNGRHKVFGSVALNVPPQTSTIASHLPKAVGLALSINQNRILKNNLINEKSDKNILGPNSVVICSFGDASFNHSTAQGALNTAKILSYQKIPLPIVFVCEDNKIGISVKTPKNWIKDNFSNNKLISYISADGFNLLDVIDKTKQAEQIARINKKPVFLHINTVRLMGHAGSDIEQHYLSEQEIVFNESHDPLLYTARIALDLKYLNYNEILVLYEKAREKISKLSDSLLNEPKLNNAIEVMASIVPNIIKPKAPRLISKKLEKTIFDAIMPSWDKPRNLAQGINLVMAETLAQYPNSVIFGEDVGKKGGVYRVTANLQSYFGRKRIFDTILDEQTIFGTAIGFAQNNLLPIIEIQFLAYIHNAIDQLRGEAATLSFFSGGKMANPMIIRLPGLAYQKGFGGHFHNDNSIAALREIPGIIIACPSNSYDAVRMWRSLVKLAYLEHRICTFLEPIALYFTKDLYNLNDNKLLFNYPEYEDKLLLGDINIINPNTHIALISYGNGFNMAQQAANILINKYNLNVTLIDIRWLKPLPIENIYKAILQCENLIIIDECRKTGSISEELMSCLYHKLKNDHLLELIKITRITAEDSFIPLGPAADHVLPSVKNIIDSVLEIYKI